MTFSGADTTPLTPLRTALQRGTSAEHNGRVAAAALSINAHAVPHCPVGCAKCDRGTTVTPPCLVRDARALGGGAGERLQRRTKPHRAELLLAARARVAPEAASSASCFASPAPGPTPTRHERRPVRRQMRPRPARHESRHVRGTTSPGASAFAHATGPVADVDQAAYRARVTHSSRTSASQCSPRSVCSLKAFDLRTVRLCER